MEYLTCKQAAYKWKVRTRVVQRWCQNGKIPGVVKEGQGYRIPIDSVRPKDKRLREKELNEERYLVLISDPDNSTFKDDPFALRFKYLIDLNCKGCIEEAEQGYLSLLSEFIDDCHRLPVLIQLSIVESQLGNVDFVTEVKQEILKIVSSGKYPLTEAYIKCSYDVQISTVSNIIPEDMLPEYLLRSMRNLVFKSVINPTLICTNHFELLCRYIEINGGEMVQAYCHSMLASFYFCFGNNQLRDYHQDKAREIILRRKWYLLFAEYTYFLDWKLEQYVDDSEELYKIYSIIKKIFDGYISYACKNAMLTNPELMSPNLLKVAVLRSIGCTYSEIGYRMNISPYYVRKFIDELNVCTDNADQNQLSKIVWSTMWFM